MTRIAIPEHDHDGAAGPEGGWFLPAGWWILPGVALGGTIWAVLIAAVF